MFSGVQILSRKGQKGLKERFLKKGAREERYVGWVFLVIPSVYLDSFPSSSDFLH